MNNRTVLVAILAIAAAIVADSWLNGGRASLFLLRKMVDLIDYVTFWR